MRKYLIIPTIELSKINFNEVLEASPETIRYSVDKTKAIIKWDLKDDPKFISDIVDAEGPYNYEEILNIISDTNWTPLFQKPSKNLESSKI